MTIKEFVAFTRLDASDVNAQLVNRPVHNAIINGAFEINQRAYVSAANLASGAYGFDRWKSTFTNTTLTYTAAPAGQLVTINSGGSIKQVVERANLAAGTYTLSWQGTATARIYNSGATPPAYAASPITVTLDGLADVDVELTAAGSTKTLGYVKLESGTSEGPFCRNANSLQGELAACQRYYQRINSDTASGLYWSIFQALSTTATVGSIWLTTTMRSSPTVSFSSPSHFFFANSVGSGLNATAMTATVTSPNFFRVTGTVASGLVAGNATLLSTATLSAFIEASAEL
jgi:hypothetical protein